MLVRNDGLELFAIARDEGLLQRLREGSEGNGGIPHRHLTSVFEDPHPSLQHTLRTHTYLLHVSTKGVQLT
jgi:hypothetical protein